MPPLLQTCAAGETGQFLDYFWDVGCDVAGPLLLAYVLWVLSQARTQGIVRIYFLARDGEILLQIARRLCHWLGWTIDCRYLYASRQSFAFPALAEIDETSLHWLVDWSETPTIRVILKRLALTPGEIQEELVGVDFLPSNWDRGLSVAEVEKLIRILKQPQIRERILGTAQSYRQTLLDYLRQEGLADGARWSLCDIGWRGLIQTSLDRITENHPEFPKRYGGFYFGLNTDALLIERSRADVFQSANMSWASWIMDIFCAAEHGSVNRFERQSDGTIRPVLGESAEDVSYDRTTSTQQAAILGFVDELTAQTLRHPQDKERRRREEQHIGDRHRPEVVAGRQRDEQIGEFRQRDAMLVVLIPIAAERVGEIAEDELEIAIFIEVRHSGDGS